ncbi:MAG TPA: hypothetical protein VFQ61_38775 [Polyangiaceae bacterium]|nr:hypothetical protein [Polyangiaceae bacterium]
MVNWLRPVRQLRPPPQHMPLEAIKMLTFPILMLFGEHVASFKDEAALRRSLSLVTDKGLKNGFIGDTILVDSDLNQHAILAFQLKGREPLFGWLRSGREIIQFETTPARRTTLPDIKRLLLKRISQSEWEDVPSLVAAIESATEFSALVEPFAVSF